MLYLPQLGVSASLGCNLAEFSNLFVLGSRVMHSSGSRCTVVFRCLIVFCVLGCTAGFLTAQRPSDNAELQPSGDTKADFRLQQARTYLKYAEINLKLAESANARRRNTVPEERIVEYRERVQLAKALLASAEQEEANNFEIYVGMAEAAYRIELASWKRAKEVQSVISNPNAELEIERLRLKSELARLIYQRGKSLIDASRAEQDEWKFDYLTNEVLRLRHQVRRLSFATGR